MRVLLDENIPHDLIRQFPGNDVSTVQDLGWAGIKNGDLLERARGTIDVFVTMDRKPEKQHDLSVLPFGVVVILARSNRMVDLLPLTEALWEVLPKISTGKVEHVGGRGQSVAGIVSASTRCDHGSNGHPVSTALHSP